MFRRIVAFDTADNSPETNRNDRANALFNLHPHQISTLLEMAWEFCVKNQQNAPPDSPGAIRIAPINALPPSLLRLFGDYIGLNANDTAFNFYLDNANRTTTDNPNLAGLTRWDHLIYAFCIENTRIYDIFRRIIFEYRHGETLSVPQVEAYPWLRNTEELFYSDHAPFRIYNISSHIRPDYNAHRRNIYYRMFGMDLNHGDHNNNPVKYHKADLANTEFVRVFEDFLREVWVGIVNNSNTVGLNPTDDASIANLARQLSDMLQNRRRLGNLTREEFFFVAMMSWFHLTVEFDSPIIQSLRAEGPREDQRLFRVAELAKLPAHAKSYDFFQLADPLSRILTQIETGIYNNTPTVPALYQQGSQIENDMRTIIIHWSIATGRDLKVRKGTDTGGNMRSIVPRKNGVKV